ncbi:MAG: sporulation integral membrane protein YtvI [Clostridia bacterium]|nr:sporulation integral membrane protein YtvI [Clostridia bacterium]
MGENYLPREKWARILVCGAYVVLGAGLLFLLGKVFPAVAPFIVALIIARLIARPVSFISRHTRIPRGLVAVVLCAVTIAAVALTLFFVGGRIVTGAADLVDYLDGAAAGIVEKIGSLSGFLHSKFPSLDNMGGGEMIEKTLNQVVETVMGKASEFVTGAAASIVSGAPSAFLFIIVTVVASFYFSCGYPAMAAFVGKRLPEGLKKRAEGWLRAVRRTVGAYVRCSVIMALVTFGVLSVGFSVIRIKDPVLTAGLCAFIDVLPVFGAGTVLVPWAVVKIISSEYAVGFGLATIYGICALARQILEPRLMSGSLGIHPAASLAAMYVGFRFFGLPGMLFMPLMVSAVIAGNESGRYGGRRRVNAG